VNQDIDDRSPVAKALSKVSHITAISLMMIVPALIGYFIDQYFGTVILFTGLGLVLGVVSAVWQLIQFVAHQDDSGPNENVKGG
jgi:F0F1-type ATP synthase assembly protein I